MFSIIQNRVAYSISPTYFIGLTEYVVNFVIVLRDSRVFKRDSYGIWKKFFILSTNCNNLKKYIKILATISKNNMIILSSFAFTVT